MTAINLRALVIALCLLATQAATQAQTPAGKESPQKPAKAARPARGSSDPLAAERRATAISLATNLAEEARSFRDEQLRARVQMRVADAMWETDQEQARALFRRAWEAAEAGDSETLRRLEESQRSQASGGGRTVTSPAELRGEVLRLVSRRDRALGEEFLTKLTEAAERENRNLATGAGAAQATVDPEDPPFAIAQRLLLARRFLEEGDTERALQFADKALGLVTTRGVNFLSTLREKDQAAADKRFSEMLQRAAADPTADAVAVSVLSSYAFTPFLTVVVRGDGRNHSSQEREHIVAPNISPELRLAFLSTAAQILLRPVPPREQDRTLAGRGGLYFTLARLLPLFQRYAPDLAAEIGAQMSALSADAPERFRTGKDPMLTRGLVPEGAERDEGQEALETADRAANAEERDMAYARAATDAAHKGEAKARELANKIEDSDLRKRTLAYVDFTLTNRAIERKDVQEALRLARSGELTSVHRVWVLTEIARLLKKTDAKRAAELLDEAAMEARRIDASDADRARALFGVATRMHEVDRQRVWEVVAEAVKAANSSTGFTGADAQIMSRLQTAHGTTTTNFDVESFNLEGLFGLLAREDLSRTVELAKNFQAEAPRAAATLAIVRAILDQKRRASRNENETVTGN